MKTRRRSRRGLAVDPPIVNALAPFRHHDRDLETCEMDTQAEMLSTAEGQHALDGPIPNEVVGIGVLPLVTVGRCEQRDDA